MPVKPSCRAIPKDYVLETPFGVTWAWMSYCGTCHVPREAQLELDLGPGFTEPKTTGQEIASPACQTADPGALLIGLQMLFLQEKFDQKKPAGSCQACSQAHMQLATLAPHQKTGPQEFLRNGASAIPGLLAHYARGWAGLRTCIMHDAPAYLCA